MKTLQLFSSMFALAVLVTASPAQKGTVAGGPHIKSASGCNAAADPHCCVPEHCQCSNGWYYQFNIDNLRAGGNGCDPPWGFLGTSIRDVPGYCC